MSLARTWTSKRNSVRSPEKRHATQSPMFSVRTPNVSSVSATCRMTCRRIVVVPTVYETFRRSATAVMLWCASQTARTITSATSANVSAHGSSRTTVSTAPWHALSAASRGAFPTLHPSQMQCTVALL